MPHVPSSQKWMSFYIGVGITIGVGGDVLLGFVFNKVNHANNTLSLQTNHLGTERGLRNRFVTAMMEAAVQKGRIFTHKQVIVNEGSYCVTAAKVMTDKAGCHILLASLV